MTPNYLISLIRENMQRFFPAKERPAKIPLTKTNTMVKKIEPLTYVYKSYNLPPLLPNNWTDDDLFALYQNTDPEIAAGIVVLHFSDEVYANAKTRFHAFIEKYGLPLDWWLAISMARSNFRDPRKRLTEGFMRYAYHDGPSLFSLMLDDPKTNTRLRFLANECSRDNIYKPWIEKMYHVDKINNDASLTTFKRGLSCLISWHPDNVLHLFHVLVTTAEMYSNEEFHVLTESVLSELSPHQTGLFLNRLDDDHMQVIPSTSFAQALWEKNPTFEWSNPIRALYMETSGNVPQLKWMPTFRKNLDTICLFEDLSYFIPFGNRVWRKTINQLESEECSLRTDLDEWPMVQDEQSYTYAALTCALLGIQAQWKHPKISPLFQDLCALTYYHMALKKGFPVEKPHVQEPFAWLFQSANPDGSWWAKDTAVYNTFADLKKWLFIQAEQHFEQVLSNGNSAYELEI